MDSATYLLAMQGIGGLILVPQLRIALRAVMRCFGCGLMMPSPD